MHLRATDDNAHLWKVFFNDRWAPYAIEANDTEGWIVVLDQEWLKRVAPVDTIVNNDPGDEVPEELEQLGTKRISGKVRFQRVVIEEK